MMRVLCSCMVVVFLAVSPAGAEERIVLTLRDAVAKALENNLPLKVESLNREVALSGIMITRGEFDPLVGAELYETYARSQSPSVVASSEERAVEFGVFLQGKAVTGTGYELRWNNERFRGDSSFLTVNPYYTSDLTLTLFQPLLKGWGVSVQTARIREAEHLHEIAKLTFEGAAEDTAMNTVRAYWEVVAAKSALAVADFSLRLARNVHEEVTAKIRAGVLAPVDIYQAEAEIAVREEEIMNAQNGLQDAIDGLRNIMNLDDWTADIDVADAPPEATSLPAPDDAVHAALDRRRDYRSALIDRRTREILQRYYRNQRLPEANLVGAAGLNGVDAGYGDALDNLGSGDYYSWRVGLSLVFPLGNNIGEGNYRKANYERAQAEERVRELGNAIRLQVRQGWRALELASKRIEAKEKILEAAKKRYEAEDGRFRVGLATLNDVIAFQREYVAALNDARISRAQYAAALSDFHRVQGTLLESLDLSLQ